MTERFELPAEMNIYSALETRDALLAWAKEESAKARDFMEVSARDVAEVDGAGLQLLVALTNMGLSWQLVESSDAFADACRTMGLASWLDNRFIKAGQAGAGT